MRRIKMWGSGYRAGQSRDAQATYLSIFYPRIWKFLIVLALPFLIFCSNYFEALERTGIPGAYFADLLLPVTIIGYIVFLYVLRRRDI